MQPNIDLANCRPGRVLAVYCLTSLVETAEGAIHRCTTRRLLRTLSTDQRHVVAAGDNVFFRDADSELQALTPRLPTAESPRLTRGPQLSAASSNQTTGRRPVPKASLNASSRGGRFSAARSATSSM